MQVRTLLDTDDKLKISEIYEKSWKVAYSNIFSKEFLDSIEPGKWVDFLSLENINTLVLEDEGKFLGTLSYSKSRFLEMEDWGEIISLYILPEYTGNGLGKILFKEGINNLSKLNFENIFLYVLEENKRAIKFYERMGFKYSGEYINDNVGGKDVKELKYCMKLNNKWNLWG